MTHSASLTQHEEHTVPMPDTTLTQATPDELATLFLRGRDVPCPGCTYNRRDGTSATCPECRYTLIVSYAVSIPRQLKLALLGMLACINLLIALPAMLWFVGEGMEGSYNFGAWYGWAMLGVAITTFVLHGSVLRFLVIRSRDAYRVSRRLTLIACIALINLAVTSTALQFILLDYWL